MVNKLYETGYFQIHKSVYFLLYCWRHSTANILYIKTDIHEKFTHDISITLTSLSVQIIHILQTGCKWIEYKKFGVQRR